MRFCKLRNKTLFIPLDQIPRKFPNLKDLNLCVTKRVQQDPPTTQPFPPTFQLKKLSISLPSLQAQQHHLQQYLSQLTHLRLDYWNEHSDLITQLFHPQHCVVRNLTVLDLSRVSFSCDNLSTITQCPFLSNLTALKLNIFVYVNVDHLIQSPFLLSPKLKHLELNIRSYQNLTALVTALDAANPKLETYGWRGQLLPLDTLATSPVFSQLKHCHFDYGSLTKTSFPTAITNVSNNNTLVNDTNNQPSWDIKWKQFIQSPNLSNFVTFTLPWLYYNNVLHEWTEQDAISLLTSPMMSNGLVELNISAGRGSITDDVIDAIFTARVMPVGIGVGGDISPLSHFFSVYSDYRRISFSHYHKHIVPL